MDLNKDAVAAVVARALTEAKIGCIELAAAVTLFDALSSTTSNVCRKFSLCPKMVILAALKKRVLINFGIRQSSSTSQDRADLAERPRAWFMAHFGRHASSRQKGCY